ncbi:MAG: Negative regulator of RcsB-dependent stress response [Gemmatimonadetes bacterium]|nr:Negative regulator of RcsB-dependent stress response [Gemmatimonadota bacterium]
MASSVASRTPRAHAPIDNDDAVMARAVAFASWARTNARILTTATGLVLVAAAGYMYYRYYESHREGRAGAEFLMVAAEARNGGNEAVVSRDLDNFYHKFDGTVEADQARLLLGQIKLKNNQPKAALPLFDAVGGHRSPLRVQGMMLAGATKAASGDLNGAAVTLRSAADQAKLAYEKNQALRQLALVQEQKGDWPGAVATWQQLVDATEKGSPERGETEMRLGEAQAHVPAAR